MTGRIHCAILKLGGLAALLIAVAAWSTQVAKADVVFDRWLQSVWPDAQALGVSRATFDAALRGLEPDYSLTDLAIPGRPEKQPQQPEFVQTPSQYLREASFDRLARTATSRRSIATL